MTDEPKVAFEPIKETEVVLRGQKVRVFVAGAYFDDFLLKQFVYDWYLDEEEKGNAGEFYNMTADEGDELERQLVTAFGTPTSHFLDLAQ